MFDYSIESLDFQIQMNSSKALKVYESTSLSTEGVISDIGNAISNAFHAVCNACKRVIDYIQNATKGIFIPACLTIVAGYVTALIGLHVRATRIAQDTNAKDQLIQSAGQQLAHIAGNMHINLNLGGSKNPIKAFTQGCLNKINAIKVKAYEHFGKKAIGHFFGAKQPESRGILGRIGSGMRSLFSSSAANRQQLAKQADAKMARHNMVGGIMAMLPAAIVAIPHMLAASAVTAAPAALVAV